MLSRGPYRTNATPPREGRVEEPNADILPVIALLWVSSIVRVVFGLARGHVAGTELLLACAFVLALPYVIGPPLVRITRTRTRRRRDVRSGLYG